MKDIKKRYKKDDLTVVWEPGKCMHSTNCWKGLLSVFNPQKKPWVNLDGAEKDVIIHHVKNCPSGALSYIINEENTLQTS